MLSNEIDSIIVYEFLLEEAVKPIAIIANNLIEASAHLKKGLLAFNKDFSVVDLQLFTPITGITGYEKDGIKYVWGGFDYSLDGFITVEEFEKLEIDEKFPVVL